MMVQVLFGTESSKVAMGINGNADVGSLGKLSQTGAWSPSYTNLFFKIYRYYHTTFM